MNGRNLLVALMALLEREGTVSIPQAARLLNTGEEDVWNALDVLVFCYDAVSVRLDLHSAYAHLDSGGRGRLLRLNEEETGLLLDVLQAQGFAPDQDLCRKLLETKGFLASPSGEQGQDGKEARAEDTPRATVQMVNTGNVAGIIQTIARACDDGQDHLLAIEYQKEGASKTERRTVEPYALVSEGDHRYLQAYCRTAGGWRSFRADRIKRASLLDETYVPRKDMPQPIVQRGEGGDVARVRFKAGAPLPTWPGLLVRKENPDGSRDAEIPWLGGLWLPKRIVGMLGEAISLEPPELVESTRAYAEQLLLDQ